MIYKNLSFQLPTNRPFFYTDLVMTIDGKIFVKKDGYWPIGSQFDYQVFRYLRAHADIILQGAQSALTFGKQTISTLHDPLFTRMREQAGKQKKLDYIILSKNPIKLKNVSKNDYGYKPQVLPLHNTEEIVRYVQNKKYQYVYIDGSKLLYSFLKANLLDEIFLTISPKILGGRDETVTIAEGDLFSPSNIKQFTLVSTFHQGNEVFLRYRKRD